MNVWLCGFFAKEDITDEGRWGVFAYDEESREWVFHLNYNSEDRAWEVADHFATKEFSVYPEQWDRI